MNAPEIPGPRAQGWLARRRRLAAFAGDSVGVAAGMFRQFGPMVALTRGRNDRLYSPLPECPGIFLTHGAEAFREVGSRHDVYGKFPLTGQLFAKRRPSGRAAPLNRFLTGLFGANGDEHRRNRRLLMPAFHRQRLELYARDMAAISESQFETWRAGARLDIAAEMQALTLRIASKTLFGEEVSPEGVSTGRLLRDIVRLCSHWLTVTFPWDLPGLPYRRFLDAIAVYEAEMRRIIQRRRQSGNGPNDVLSMLLQAQDADTGTPLTEDEVLGHVGVLFAAGHETSANALTWTLFLLSQHPRVASDLRDELQGLLRGGPAGSEHLDRLPLLERVVQESLRLLPPVPWNARVLLEPAELNGASLPAGAEVWLSIFETHRSPAVFPEPDRFRPERWETARPSRFEYVPFSAGPRTCIGAGFALMEIRLILANLLPRFSLELSPQAVIDRSGIVVLTPRRGMPMELLAPGAAGRAPRHEFAGNLRELVCFPAAGD